MGIHQLTLSYKRLLDVLPELVDEHTGIISSVEEQPGQENMPDLFYYIARGANTQAIISSGYTATTAGVSTNRVVALCKAVGEGVERYCGGLYDEKRLVKSSFAKLDVNAIHPDTFALFSADQYAQTGFPFSPFNKDTVLRWTSGIELSTQKEILVPASLVYVPYDTTTDEAKIGLSGSTGLAAHCSFEEAALNGILEVIERDCFSITWLAMMQRPLIHQPSLTVEHHDLIHRFEVVGYNVSLVDIRNETGIPAVMGVLESNGAEGLVQYALSAAVHLDPVVAVKKCLEELCLMERYTRRAMLTEWSGPGKDFKNIRGYFDHVKLYNSEDFKSNANFLTASPDRVNLTDMRSFETGSIHTDLSQTVNILTETGNRVIVADVTTADMASLGLHVVRAIIPQYHPHVPGFATRALGGSRWKTIPQKLGYIIPGQAQNGNPYPHPFA